MTDPVVSDPVNPLAAVPAPSDPAVPATGADDLALPAPPRAGAKKSPLDVLEEILKDAQSNKSTSGADGAGGTAERPDVDVTDPAASARTEAGPTEDDQLAAIRAQQTAQQAEDQVQLQQKIAELANIKETPQYQARVEQQQKEEQQRDEQTTAAAGFEIRQLDHTKLANDQLQPPS